MVKEIIRITKELKNVIQPIRKYIYIILVLSLLQVPILLITPLFYKTFIDEVLLKGRIRIIFIVIIWNILAYCILLSIGVIKLRCENKFYNILTYKVREEIFQRYVVLPYDVFKEYHIGDMKMRIDEDIESIKIFYKNEIVDFVLSVIMLIGNGIMMFCMNATLSLIALSLLPITFIMGQIIGRKEMEITDKKRVVNGKKKQWMYNSLQNWKEIKALNLQRKEKSIFTKYYHLIGIYDAKWIICWLMNSLIIPAIKDEFIMRFSLYLIGGLLILKGKLSIGALLVFITYFIKFYEYVNKINSYSIELKNALPCINRVLEILKIRIDLRPTTLKTLDGTIEVKNLSYKYSDKHTKVLDDISFTINTGETVAIVGKSGVGKSTLVKLLAGILKADEGEIFYDNKPIGTISTDELYKNIGIIMQDSQLFNLTIRDNLTFGQSNISDDRLDDICTKVNIKEFIEKLPKGYDTLIGENGVKLSGGQRQRIVVARTLLSQCKILILDEATSSLDSESENIIRETISILSKTKTVIIIAHRFSSIISADYILVLEDGKIAGYNTHKKLRRNNIAYDRLFECV